MAFLTLEDVYGSLECVCFPASYEKCKGDIAPDKVVKVKGKLDIDAEKGISLIIDELVSADASLINGEAKTEKREAVLWLNAGKLDDEEFDEFVNMLANYEGDTICKIVRGTKRYILPSGINYCRGLLAELGTFLKYEDIKFVDSN